MAKPTVYPYIANSVPEVKKAMLREIGVKDVEELYKVIPQRFLLKRRLDLPKPSPEYEVKRHLETLLSRNASGKELLSFLGAGCWPHHIPAVCNEIANRSEFVTAYAGDTYSDLGKCQALFEFQSMIGELVAMDVVSFPMYDWATVCGEAARMAFRITGRGEFLVPKTISPGRLAVMRNYCHRLMDIKLINYHAETGQLDLEDLKNKISSKTAGVYFENPSYLGFIEYQGSEISDIAHDLGALSIVGVEPISLGMLTPPGEYGADIVVGEGQPLGNHMNYGGGLLGIFACQDEDRLVSEMPTLMTTITTTQREGEYGFSYWTLPVRLFYNSREKGKSATGTSCALWGIAAAVYMALMGPKGLRELGEVIMYNSNYAMKLISEIRGVEAPLFDSIHFEEFTVNFEGTGKTPRDVNKALLKHGIQGGKDIMNEFPELGKSALYCVTEIHTKEDVERLAAALKEVVR